MPTQRDYYEILSVSRTASGDEISTAYRKLAIKYHPDKNPGDEEAIARFKEAAEAFEVLNDSQKRQRYDQFGHAGVNGQAGGGGFEDGRVLDRAGDQPAALPPGPHAPEEHQPVGCAARGGEDHVLLGHVQHPGDPLAGLIDDRPGAPTAGVQAGWIPQVFPDISPPVFTDLRAQG